MLRCSWRCHLGALALTLAGAAQAQSLTHSCTSPRHVSSDSLVAMARRLHPEALAPENADKFLAVGLVLSPECEVLRHAVGRRAPDGLQVTRALARLFPDSLGANYVAAGGFDPTAGRAAGEGRPLILWGLVRTTSRPR